MAINGFDVLLLVNTGSDAAPTWTAVGSQRNVSFEETTASIDASSKDQREKRVLPGRYAATVSLDALYVPDDAAFLALQAANRAGELIKIRRERADTAEEEATALITSMTDEHPDQDASTISVDLEIDGAWSAVSS